MSRGVAVAFASQAVEGLGGDKSAPLIALIALMQRVKANLER